MARRPAHKAVSPVVVNAMYGYAEPTPDVALALRRRDAAPLRLSPPPVVPHGQPARHALGVVRRRTGRDEALPPSSPRYRRPGG